MTIPVIVVRVVDKTSSLLHRDSSYLSDHTLWGTCTEPKDIVQFHIGLFSTLLATSCLQVVLCAIQMINGLFGCLCGTCMEKGVSTFFHLKYIYIKEMLYVLLTHHVETMLMKFPLVFHVFPATVNLVRCLIHLVKWRPLLVDKEFWWNPALTYFYEFISDICYYLLSHKSYIHCLGKTKSKTIFIDNFNVMS